MSAGRATPAAPPVHTLRDLAVAAARAGGDFAARHFGARHATRLKADFSEVTAIDEQAQAAIIALLREARPQDAFLGEEATELSASYRDRTTTAESVVWAIDPVDGTRNFARAAPLFVCSVCALWRGAPLAGAVYDPLRGDLYAAGLGLGATRNGEPLGSRDTPPAPAEKLLVAIPSVRHGDLPGVRAALERHVVRNLGCTALHLALVAAGVFDASISNNSKLWDIAAGALLVTEAGRVATTPNGDPLFPIDLAAYDAHETPCLAGSPAAHAALRG